MAQQRRLRQTEWQKLPAAGAAGDGLLWAAHRRHGEVYRRSSGPTDAVPPGAQGDLRAAADGARVAEEQSVRVQYGAAESLGHSGEHVAHGERGHVAAAAQAGRHGKGAVRRGFWNIKVILLLTEYFFGHSCWTTRTTSRPAPTPTSPNCAPSAFCTGVAFSPPQHSRRCTRF